MKTLSAAAVQDAVAAYVHRVHAAESFKRLGHHIDAKLYHNMDVDIRNELMQLRSLRLVDNFDVKSSPFPGDANDVLTSIVVRIGNQVQTANLRMSHGIWLYKVWCTPLPELGDAPRINAHAVEITNAAALAAQHLHRPSTQPETEAIDLNDPDSLAKHGITDLSQ